MRVEVDGQTDLLAQGPHQQAGRRRPQQAGHVLDGQQVGPPFLQFPSQTDVILQGIFVAFRVEDIAGVAHGGLAQHPRRADGLDGQRQVGQTVQGVEDAEQVDAGVSRFLDEGLDDVIGVVGVTDGTGRAQQHLEQQIGHLLAQGDETLPRRFLEEAHRRVEGRSAPHFQREQASEPAGVERGDPHHVVGAHPRRQQRLMGVPKRRVRQLQSLLLEDPAGKLLGTELLERIAAAGRHDCVGRQLRHRSRLVDRRQGPCPPRGGR